MVYSQKGFAKQILIVLCACVLAMMVNLFIGGGAAFAGSATFCNKSIPVADNAARIACIADATVKTQADADNFYLAYKAGLGTSGQGTVTDLTDELKKQILNVRIIGSVIAVLGLVLGAIMFSISMGNSQRRGIASACMLGAVVGIIIIAKAPQVADYFIKQQ